MDMYCIVYDITNRNSFKNCGTWLEQLSQSRGDHNIFGIKLNIVFLVMS
jgi:GTPase SAR1 family protein